MKIHEYNEMMAHLTRPAVNRTGFKYGGTWKDYMLRGKEYKDLSFEEWLREDKAHGGVIGKGGMFQGEDLGNRTGFRKISANQYGEFTTKAKIGAPITGETISKSEFNKIKKLLKDRPGIGIYPTGREGAYTIKVKVEKAGTIIQEDLLYSKDNLDTMLKKWQSARDKLFPNQITDAKFKELRLLNDTLTDAQFADLLNENNYLTSKGNRFNATTAFNWKKRLDLGSLGPREFRTIGEAEKILKEKFGKNFKQIFKTDKEIFAKATQIVNDVGKYKGSFPRGAGAENFLWHSFDRAASKGSKQISYDLSALGNELPMEDGKVNWNKKIKGQPAWKLVKFIDNDVGQTFSWSDKTGSLKNQVNTAYNNTNKFNNAVKGFYEQAQISQEFKNATRDKFLLKELEAKLGRKITKADDELVKNWLKNRRPGFSLTQVHHPEGVVKNVYNTQNVFTAANLKERDLLKTFNKEVKTIGQKAAQENYNKALQSVSDEFGGIQKKVGSRYVGDAPTMKSMNKTINTLLANANTETIMKVRKALGCDLASGGRVGLQGGGNLLECPMAKFAQDPEGTLNKVGQAVPETRSPIMNALKKFGGGTLKWGGRAFIGLTPIFAGMEIADAARKYEEGVPSGQIAMDAFGNWVIPGAGGMYKTYQDRKMMKDIGSSEEIASMDKARKLKWYEMLQEDDPLREADYSKKLEETQTTPDEQLEFFKLMEKQKAAEYWNQQRRKGERAKVAEESTDTFSNLEDWSAAEGGRAGFSEAGIVDPGLAEDKAFETMMKAFKYYKKHGGKKSLRDYMRMAVGKKRIGGGREHFRAEGGRIGFDEGSKPKNPGRRAFIKGITALAALPIVGKYFKLGKVLERAKTYTGPTIEKIKGMPEWFPGLVKKLWNEGEDVTKKVAYNDRQVVKRGTLEGGDDIDMVYDLDTGDVSINVTPKKGTYETGSGAYNKEYSLDYKKGIADEGTKGKPADDFAVTETEPVRTGHPEDPDWDFDGIETTVDDALSDLTELEAFAKNKSTTQIHKKKGTMKKNVNPDEGYDLDAYYDPETGTYYDK